MSLPRGWDRITQLFSLRLLYRASLRSPLAGAEAHALLMALLLRGAGQGLPLYRMPVLLLPLLSLPLPIWCVHHQNSPINTKLLFHLARPSSRMTETQQQRSMSGNQVWDTCASG
ncbi:hypothetical protein JZ751_008387 [Albula glossodonta]|uniref:Uncharacterized protein n=1 Tax=Albula glossodonta TaxID=121402 RepID=A0A8T2N4B0_9TELE|nr:hypothetical protein JZ751_008387 [Albula glossodonta]